MYHSYNLWKTLIIHLSLRYSFLFSEPFKLCTPFNGSNEEEEPSEEPVVEEFFKNVEVSFPNLSAVDHIEELQEDKDVKK